MVSLKSWWGLSQLPSSSSRSKLRSFAFSIADQALSVGGMLLANVALARSASKEEYGVFALSYSVYTFLAGLHNAAILEAYTVFGAGRYRQQYAPYAFLVWKTNAWLAVGLSALLLLAWRILAWTAPALASRSLLGLALASGIILTASLARRMLYVQRLRLLAAKLSLIFFFTLAISLWAYSRLHAINGFTTFLAIALSWAVALICMAKHLPRKHDLENFLQAQPQHWHEHWKYARWVLVTALVFQFTNQGYYWVVAGLLSLRDVGQLRAIYILVTPMDQVFAALTLLVLPLMATKYASNDFSGLLSLWKRFFATCLSATVIFAIAVFFLKYPLVHLIYHGKFDEVASLLGILGLLPILMGIGNTMNAALKALERPNAVLYAYLASGTTTFLVGIPLVKFFGLRGAVYGLLLSGAAYTIALGIGFFMASSKQTPLNSIPHTETGWEELGASQVQVDR